jgi:serine/threonine protein kinase
MIGEQLGNWKIIKKINRGGMADIFLAQEVNSSTDEPARAAIKILRFEDDDSPGLSERFQREIEVLRTLKHDNIVRLYDSGEYGGRPYLVMEYVDGLSLDQVLEQRRKLHWEEVVAIAQMVAGALRYAHRQEVIHRDLKPANLLASWDRVVKLTDFGIARLLHDNRLTKDRTIIGTASYLSPEQAAGKPATRKSDLYSLGIVMYELATGRLPFEASTDAEMLHKQRYAQFELPSRLVEEIPHDFDELVVSLMEKEPEKRPANAQAVEEALLRLRRKFDRKRQYTPTPAARPTKVMNRPQHDLDDESVPSHAALRSRSNQVPWLQVVLILAALAGLYGLYSWLRQPTSAPALISQIEHALQGGEWSLAQRYYDDLAKYHKSDVAPERLQSIEQEIAGVKTFEQAKRQSGPFTFTAPRSEAERFYRRGVMAYFDGRTEEACKIWEELIAAFRPLPAESAWVRLAEEALKQSDGPGAVTLDEALKQVPNESQNERAARLNQLKQLYQALPDSPLKKSALEKIDKSAGK